MLERGVSLSDSAMGVVVGCFEHGGKPSTFIQCEVFVH
jgi:hypothetical protein